MLATLFDIIVGSLLHDIGKVVYRAGDLQSHPISGMQFTREFTESKNILDCIRYHHWQDIVCAELPEDSPAYITYIADNISSGSGRREVEGETGQSLHFDKETPLDSVFNLLNGNKGEQIFRPAILSRNSEIRFPESRSGSQVSMNDYATLLQGIRESLKSIRIEPDYINSVLEILEKHLTYVPSSTLTGRITDISLFDHSKTTAAIASCLYLYLAEKGINDYKSYLMQYENDFYNEKAFLMLSCDISGIQKFIYTIPGKGAMKSLRARSFYLEILLEHVVDLLLKETGLSRANLIYSGGGHAYILLPNSSKTHAAVDSVFNSVNKWLTDRFGVSLYIAKAIQECSANDLMNKPGDQAPYRQIFISLSHRLSYDKLRRYSPEDIRTLNRRRGHQDNGRECKVCGTVDSLVTGEDLCRMCKSFIEVSNDLIFGESVLLVTRETLDCINAFTLPGQDNKDCFAVPLSVEKARAYLEDKKVNVVGIYGKNGLHTGLKYYTNIWMGDYFAKSTKNEFSKEAIATFEEIADKSKGIKRLAVLRADVDNLGKAFISGFLRPDEADAEKRTRYLTLSRTASLSRMLSLFFKLSINKIMDQPSDDNGMRLSTENCRIGSGRCLTIVYSGGDDVFIAGAWNEVIEAAVDLRNAFRKFSGGTLHLSAGIGIYTYSYPIAMIAEETARLEEAAKNMDGKDSVALFGMGFDSQKGCIEAKHVYKWDEFENKVIGEKLRTLQEYFGSLDNIGSSLMHRFLDYIRGMETDRINLARFAYQLGKLQPDQKDDMEKQQMYEAFCRKMYKWFISEEDRRQLMTAIHFMIYLNRNNERPEGVLENG